MVIVEPDLPPPPKKHEPIIKFGHTEPQPQGPDLRNVTNDINTLSRRLRLLEEGFTNLRRFFQLIEENIIAKNKHYSAEIRTIVSDTTEIRKEIQDLKDKFLLVVKELQTVARKEEVKVLEKYINLWNPIKFVTQNEIEDVIDELLDKRLGTKNERK